MNQIVKKVGKRCYAGIGSRRTPPDVLWQMEAIAEQMAMVGIALRSGHAPGADQAFERGAGERAAIYLPWPGFEVAVPLRARHVFDRPTPAAYEMAAEYHPRWHSLKQGAKALMARNCHQVLGLDLRTPVREIICWTPGGRGEGGTGQALRIGRDYNIPICDLALEEDSYVFETASAR